MTALSALTPTRGTKSPRVRYTAMDSATLLARFGLAPRLVCRWAADEQGRLTCLWEAKLVPHRPLLARIAIQESRDG